MINIWTPYEDGNTLGMTGTEGGVILNDEQHEAGARITLESGCLRAPFAITTTIYNWTYHTRFFADEASARHAYNAMQPAVVDVLALLPTETRTGSDEIDDATYDAITNAIETFKANFP
ncbi:MAG: hypothetical protein GYB67_03970 [Chloroflexi bacterium]|nr:hypothetical protein [Chloroflexota bacterium]